MSSLYEGTYIRGGGGGGGGGGPSGRLNFVGFALDGLDGQNNGHFTNWRIEFWLLFWVFEVWLVLRTCLIIVIGRGFDEVRVEERGGAGRGSCFAVRGGDGGGVQCT